MRRIALLLAALAVSACGTPAPQPPPPRPVEQAPEPPPPPMTPAPQPVADACGASDMQHLVGHPRSEIPIPLKPGLQRVACTTCPVTMDYNQNRLNFFFDAQTGVIKEIKCG